MPDTGNVGFVYLRSGAERKAEAEAFAAAQAAPEAEAASEPEAPESAPVVEADAYPEGGTIPDVKAWVGDDLDRAEAALAAEMEKDPPRVTLVEYLENLLG